MAGHGGRRIEFLIPGLFGPRPAPGAPTASVARDLALPVLERLLARGRRVAGGAPGSDIVTLSCHAFGLHAPAEGDLPIAALTRAYDGAPPDRRWWVRCDPVHLRLDFNDAVLFDWRRLKLDELEAGSLVAALNEHFAEEGRHLEAGCPDCWYLAMESAPRLRTTPLPRVAGASSRGYLPEGPDAGDWRRLMNEAQMLLHAHPVNERRAARGLPVVNSVWPWGGGFLPEAQATPWAALCSSEPEALALAHHHGVEVYAPQAFRGCLAQSQGDLLVVLGETGRCVQAADPEAWRGSVVAFEENWLTPAMEGMRRGVCTELRVSVGDVASFQLTRQAARRWWRRPRRFAHWVEALAGEADAPRRA